MAATPAPHREYQPRKRLFIGLLAVACTLVLLCAFLLWWVPSVGLENIHPILPLISGAVLATLAALIVAGLSLLILTLLTGRDLFFSERLRRVVIKVLFPAIIAFGRLIGVNRDLLQQSFIALNNQLVRSRKLRVAPGRAMILLPHCIQLFDCPIRITGDVDKCRRCGECDISALAEMAGCRGVDIAVATGGTLARKLIVEKRPAFILAVACERDLTTGIRDAYPLPVIGILNHRPKGPCLDTHVILDEVARVLDDHLEPSDP